MEGNSNNASVLPFLSDNLNEELLKHLSLSIEVRSVCSLSPQFVPLPSGDMSLLDQYLLNKHQGWESLFRGITLHSRVNECSGKYFNFVPFPTILMFVCAAHRCPFSF